MRWQSRSATCTRRRPWRDMLSRPTEPQPLDGASVMGNSRKELMNFGSAILRRFVFALATLVFLVLPSAAQNTLDPGNMKASVPRITFELDWKLADPQFYRIMVDENGQATYESQPRAAENQPAGEPYRLRFIMSQPMRAK